MAGARLAEPGEFTLRAFLNGKLDLVQAEAVRRSDRGGHAAAGERGVRSTRRHAHCRDRVDRGAALRSRWRGSRRRWTFRKRAITSSAVQAARARDRSRLRVRLDALLRRRLARPDRPRRRASGDRRDAERRQIEPVQRARAGEPRDRDADCRDDARPRDGARRYRRRCRSRSSIRRVFVHATDVVEAEGVSRARQAAASCRSRGRRARRIARAR